MTDLPPEPPADVPYDELDDWYAQVLLDARGVDPSDPAALLDALTGGDSTERSLAAHQLGTLGARTARPALSGALEDAMANDDDDVAVEAAWSLARMGDEEGVLALRSLISRPISGSVVPLKAAGFLARAGDPHGIDRVREGLHSDNFLVRIAAAKQLSFFAPLDHGDLGVASLFERALADDEEDVRWAAQLQRDGR